MTEHEKFIEICDLIECESWYWDTIRRWYIYKWEEELDVREVIFTQEFMEKLTIQLEKKMWSEMFKRGLLDNLDNPVQYLYNTLWLWNQ